MNDTPENTNGSLLVPEESTAVLLSKGEMDQQIATAKKWPRSLHRALEQARALATLNEHVAQACVYSLPRDGKVVEGPSARFAEILLSAWGNCRAGARIVSEGAEFITAQGVFHDLESNSAITFEVQRRIVDRAGKRYKPDMIAVTANAACSIALRNAVLKGIPPAFWTDPYEAARKAIMGDFKTLANRREAAFKAFVAYGVSPEQIFGLLSVAGKEEITPEMLVTLRGLLTAIKDGDTTPEQAFAMKAPVALVPPAPPGGDVTGGEVKVARSRGRPRNKPREDATPYAEMAAKDAAVSAAVADPSGYLVDLDLKLSGAKTADDFAEIWGEHLAHVSDLAPAYLEKADAIADRHRSRLEAQAPAAE